MKVVEFQFKNGVVSKMNEAVADIYERRGKGKIIVKSKSVVVDGNKKDKK